MDNFFQMHNQMAQQFFAQAERDFQRFVEPPRRRTPMRQQSIKKQQSQHQDYRPRGRIDYDNNNNNIYRPLNNFNKNNNSNFNDYKQPQRITRKRNNNNNNNNNNRRFNNSDYQPRSNDNNRGNNNSYNYKKSQQKTDRGTLRREGIIATRPATSSSPKRKEYLPSSDQRLVRSTTPSSAQRRRSSLLTKTTPKTKRIFKTNVVQMVENELEGGWVERTLTPIRGTLKYCGTDVMMENKGSKFYVATYEPSKLKNFLYSNSPKSFDFKISIKACNSNQIVNCKLRIHIVLAYTSPSNFICLTGDFDEKSWRLDKFIDSSKKPKKIHKEMQATMKSNKFYTIECEIRGALLYFKVNGRYLFNDQTNGDQRRPYNLPDGDITQISRIGLMCSRSKIVFKDFKYNIDNTIAVVNNNNNGININNNKVAISKAIILPPVVPDNNRRAVSVNNYTGISNNNNNNNNAAYDDKLKEIILRDLLLKIPNITWNDIVGLENAKRTLKEAVVLPALRPDLFKGLRSPPKGVLLFGPPGTGKTMLGKCVAAVSKSSFFCISASTLTSKYHGEGEKLVRKLFETAIELQPSVIFIDEIDSLLSSRHAREHDAVRRLKTEFLIQFDGVSTNANDRVLVMGATNRPHDLDDAVLRRMEKRIYIPLPDDEARKTLLKHTGTGENNGDNNVNENKEGNAFNLTDEELNELVVITNGYSCSDIVSLCREASFGPLRDLGDDIMTAKATDMRPINYDDFINAKNVVYSSVSADAVHIFVQFNKEYGGGGV